MQHPSKKIKATVRLPVRASVVSYFSRRRPDAEVESELHDADSGDADAEAKEAANAGEEVHHAVQLGEIKVTRFLPVTIEAG